MNSHFTFSLGSSDEQWLIDSVMWVMSTLELHLKSFFLNIILLIVAFIALGTCISYQLLFSHPMEFIIVSPISQFSPEYLIGGILVSIACLVK